MMEKSYRCPICQKEYSSRQSLWNHKNSHCSGKRLAGPFGAKSAGIKRPMEFVIFNSDEFGPGGVQKSSEKLKKLVKLVNEPTSHHEHPKNIESFSPGELAEFAKPIAKPVQHDGAGPSKKELAQILKPIPKSSLESKPVQQVHGGPSKNFLA